MPNPEQLQPSRESAENPTDRIIRPAAETLLNRNEPSPWPEELHQNPDLREQIERRQQLIGEYEAVTSSFPSSMDIKEAVLSGKVDTQKLVLFYDRCAEFLNNDLKSERLILYFPAELIPDEEWSPELPELASAKERFSQAFKASWQKLLVVHDVRENFVGGDIPETEVRTGPLPRVVKGAHLLPILVEKKMITPFQAIELAENSKDEVLRQSIADALPVLDDRRLLGEESMGKLANSTDGLMRHMAEIIKSNRNPHEEESEEPVHDEAWFNAQILKLRQERGAADAAYEARRQAAPESRAAWERSVAYTEIVNRFAKAIMSEVKDYSDLEVAKKYLFESNDPVLGMVYIKAAQGALERLAKIEPDHAKEIFEKLKDSFEALLKAEQAPLVDAAESALARLHVLGVVPKETIEKFGIAIPDMEGRELQPGPEDFGGMSEAIAEDPVLNRYLLPTVLIYGSKVKGYGRASADVDVAVFIKPGTPIEKRHEIQESLRPILESRGIKDQALEFWLDASVEGLTVHDFEDPDKYQADSGLVHVLFGGAWSGRDEAIRMLHEKLLQNYFRSESSGDRKKWLEEMERDALQYRLMHKGYSHFYPERPGMDTEHSDSIDGQSTFWDKGYRRLATKLYLKKVFLPQIR